MEKTTLIHNLKYRSCWIGEGGGGALLLVNPSGNFLTLYAKFQHSQAAVVAHALSKRHSSCELFFSLCFSFLLVLSAALSSFLFLAFPLTSLSKYSREEIMTSFNT